MDENQISKIIVDTAYKIHTQIGTGLLETVYEVIFATELIRQGLKIERQKKFLLFMMGLNLIKDFELI